MTEPELNEVILFENICNFFSDISGNTFVISMGFLDFNVIINLLIAIAFKNYYVVKISKSCLELDGK